MQKSGGLTEKNSQYGVWTKIYIVGVLGFKKKIVAGFCWVVWRRRMVQKLAYWRDIFLHVNWLDKIERFVALKGNWILGEKNSCCKRKSFNVSTVVRSWEYRERIKLYWKPLRKTAGKNKEQIFFSSPFNTRVWLGMALSLNLPPSLRFLSEEKNLVSGRLIYYSRWYLFTCLREVLGFCE